MPRHPEEPRFPAGAVVTLAHGNGGRYMRELIEQIFSRHLQNPLLDPNSDAAAIPTDGSELLITTDSFTVQPLEFPGGDIGSLAVHGTVNDLAVAGAHPRYLTLHALIEEGLELAVLDRLIASLARAARDCDVLVVCGDTKVVPRGHGGGLYLATTGVGMPVPHTTAPRMARIEAGDALVISGPVGDHGLAVLLAREAFGLQSDLRSDSTSVYPLAVTALRQPGLRFMRDPTRGGLATVMHEISRATGYGVTVQGTAIPVRPAVHTACEMLGFDPLFLACEGRVLAVVAPADAEPLVSAWRRQPGGEDAATIGRITDQHRLVVLETSLRGTRVLPELEDDPLPRIC